LKLLPKIDFIVRLKDYVQPVSADSYLVDGEALLFLNDGNEVAAYFDLSIVEDWTPRLESSTKPDPSGV
jgi:hypothetical protein